MKKFVLFDWDGTLARTMNVWLDACRIVLENEGLHLSDKEITDCFGDLAPGLKLLGISDPRRVITDMENVARKMLPDASLYPDALRVLTELKRRDKRMALVTSSRRDYLTVLLEKQELSHFFEVIITSDDAQNHKPHPESLHMALAALGAHASDSIMIGDTERDSIAAHRAGVESILFYPPEHADFYDTGQLTAHQPNHIIKGLADILDIV